MMVDTIYGRDASLTKYQILNEKSIKLSNIVQYLVNLVIKMIITTFWTKFKNVINMNDIFYYFWTIFTTYEYFFRSLDILENKKFNGQIYSKPWSMVLQKYPKSFLI